MSTLPHGVIRVRIDGRTRCFLVREIHFAPIITVLGMDGEIYILPSGNYAQASPQEAARFWTLLEEAVYHKHTNSEN